MRILTVGAGWGWRDTETQGEHGRFRTTDNQAGPRQAKYLFGVEEYFKQFPSLAGLEIRSPSRFRPVTSATVLRMILASFVLEAVGAFGHG